MCISLQACFILCDRSFSWLIDVFTGCIFVGAYVWGCAHICATVHTCEHMWSPEVDFTCLPLPLCLVFVLRQHLSVKLELAEWLAGLASEVPPTQNWDCTHVSRSMSLSRARDPNSGPHALYGKHLNYRALPTPYLNFFIDTICICRACGACNPYCH